MDKSTKALFDAIQSDKIADAKKIFHEIAGRKCFAQIENRKQTVFKEIMPA